jgi:hypothetical protein
MSQPACHRDEITDRSKRSLVLPGAALGAFNDSTISPCRDVLAQEIVAELEIALEQYREIADHFAAGECMEQDHKNSSG